MANSIPLHSAQPPNKNTSCSDAEQHNEDAHCLRQFAEQAQHWWDPQGPLRTLHDVNPLRVNYIEKHAGIAQKKVLDVGCGAGILSEALARHGGIVTAIDRAQPLIDAAISHQQGQPWKINYQCRDINDLVKNEPASFDIVCCLELLEHVPDPQQFTEQLTKLVKPQGHIFVSTLNRTPYSYFGAVFMGEYIMNIIPRGTHQYAQFIRPAELAKWLRSAHCAVNDIAGIDYNPWTHHAQLTNSPRINYIMHGKL